MECQASRAGEGGRGEGGGPLNQLYREAVPRMIEVKFSANGKFAPGNVPPVNPARKRIAVRVSQSQSAFGHPSSRGN